MKMSYEMFDGLGLEYAAEVTEALAKKGELIMNETTTTIVTKARRDGGAAKIYLSDVTLEPTGIKLKNKRVLTVSLQSYDIITKEAA